VCGCVHRSPRVRRTTCTCVGDARQARKNRPRRTIRERDAASPGTDAFWVGSLFVSDTSAAPSRGCVWIPALRRRDSMQPHMHELSIAVSLVDAGCDELPKLGRVRVRSVGVRIGVLSGVAPEVLKFAFTSRPTNREGEHKLLKYQRFCYTADVVTTIDLAAPIDFDRHTLRQHRAGDAGSGDPGGRGANGRRLRGADGTARTSGRLARVFTGASRVKSSH
jgi:hypothetical protein